MAGEKHYYLGIDGGGTKTRCVLGDDTKVLAMGTAGGSNVVRLGEERAREAVHSVIRQVCGAAKISASEIQALCMGASGAGRPEIAAKIRAMIQETLAAGNAGPATPRVAQITVVGDMEIALEAAFGAGPGVIAIAGTGSVAFGRDAAGRCGRAGGWGFAISDEGSGHWIGREAVSAVVKANDVDGNDVRGNDRNEQIALAKMILEEWKLADIDALIQFANSTPPPEFPRLLRVVLRAAEQGDRAARELLARAGRELAALTEIVLRRLAPATPYIPVATTGSVFRQSEEVRRVFNDQIWAKFPGIQLREDFIEPVMGALALARIGIRPQLGDQ